MNLDTQSLLKAGGIGAGVVVVLNLLGIIPLVGVVCCCLVIVAYAGIGAGYGYFTMQEGNAADAGQFAIGGAIAAAAASVVAGIVNAIVQLILSTLGVGASTAAALSQLEGMDLPPEVASQLAGAAGFTIMGAIVGICIGFFIAAALGAIGGAIYGSTQKDKAPAAV
jgi:hypothetical protein